MYTCGGREATSGVVWRVRIREAASRRRASAAPDAVAWRREGGVGGGSSERGLFSFYLPSPSPSSTSVSRRPKAFSPSGHRVADRDRAASSALRSGTHPSWCVLPTSSRRRSRREGETVERRTVRLVIARHVAPACHPCTCSSWLLLHSRKCPPVSLTRRAAQGYNPTPLLPAPLLSAPSAWMVLVVVLVPGTGDRPPAVVQLLLSGAFRTKGEYIRLNPLAAFGSSSRVSRSRAKTRKTVGEKRRGRLVTGSRD